MDNVSFCEKKGEAFRKKKSFGWGGWGFKEEMGIFVLAFLCF